MVNPFVLNKNNQKVVDKQAV